MNEYFVLFSVAWVAWEAPIPLPQDDNTQDILHCMARIPTPPISAKKFDEIRRRVI